MEHQLAMQRLKLPGIALVMLVLTGCHSLRHSPQVTHADTSFKPLQVNEVLKQELVEVHCAGGVTCEFAQVNGINVIDSQTRRPTDEALRASLVRYEGASLLTGADTQYYVAVQPGFTEVSVRFFPVTLERAENFVVIHNFRADKVYKLNLFRQRAASSGSLLSIATPSPLCIDLLENDKVARRFCRPFEPMTGLGEFVEQKVTNNS